MIIVTTDDIEGRKVKEVLGLVKGNVVHSKNIGKDIVASFRTIVGGEIKEYTEMFTESRKKAIRRMEEEAIEKGADAVVGVRFVTSQVMQGASELMVYGTAVKFE